MVCFPVGQCDAECLHQSQWPDNNDWEEGAGPAGGPGGLRKFRLRNFDILIFLPLLTDRYKTYNIRYQMSQQRPVGFN